MSKIKTILEYDLCITTSWTNNSEEMGICGHTFEMIEYFWYIKMYMNCCLVWTETMNEELLRSILESKYNFDDKEVKVILDNSIYIHKPKLLRVKNILLVDGNIQRLTSTIIYEHMFLFSCGARDNHLIVNPKITVLHDYRIYNSGQRTIDYKKKILFYRLKSLHNVQSKSFLYLTSNCRQLDINEVKNCINLFDNIFERVKDREWLIGTDNIDNYNILEKDGCIKVKKLPIENFMEEFNHYIYTPIQRKFDCSNRLLAECKYYNKIISLYKIDEEYLNEDLGLKYRLEDIKNLESISLVRKDRDEIIDILRKKWIK